MGADATTTTTASSRKPPPPCDANLPYRERMPLVLRATACERARRQHPEHVPAILVRRSKDAPPLDREKFLLPRTLTGAQLHYIVRRRLRMEGEQALFLLCGDRLVPATATVRELEVAHRDPDDGFLYVTYALENAFG